MIYGNLALSEASRYKVNDFSEIVEMCAYANYDSVMMAADILTESTVLQEGAVDWIGKIFGMVINLFKKLGEIIKNAFNSFLDLFRKKTKEIEKAKEKKKEEAGKNSTSSAAKQSNLTDETIKNYWLGIESIKIDNTKVDIGFDAFDKYLDLIDRVVEVQRKQLKKLSYDGKGAGGKNEKNIDKSTEDFNMELKRISNDMDDASPDANFKMITGGYNGFFDKNDIEQSESAKTLISNYIETLPEISHRSVYDMINSGKSKSSAYKVNDTLGALSKKTKNKADNMASRIEQKQKILTAAARNNEENLQRSVYPIITHMSKGVTNLQKQLTSLFSAIGSLCMKALDAETRILYSFG